VTVTGGMVFSTVPGWRPLELDLHVPDSGAKALCVYLHGGGWRMGSRRAGPGPLSPTSSRLFARMTARGLAVASVDYRLSGEAVLPAQTDDVLAACTFLAARPELAGLPLVLWGVSAGGHLAALRALDGLEPPVHAAVCWYPVTDLESMPDDQDTVAGDGDRGPLSREAQVLGAPAHEDPDRARAFSPVHRVGPGAPPFLLVHGDADQAVPFHQSERLQQALLAQGATVTLVPIEGRDHMLPGIPEDDLDALVDSSADFLLGQLP
jgi:acetyl esterase/lipase